MAQPLPPDAPQDAIEEELLFLDVLIKSLDPGADDYYTQLADLEDQKAGYQRRLQDMADGEANIPMEPQQAGMGMDGSSDFWTTAMGGPPGSAWRLSDENYGSPSTQQKGLKRSLNGGMQYPSKRPTPDPSNAGTPTSSSSSFEWADHPGKYTKPAPSQSQSSKEKMRERQLRAEAAAKRQQQENWASEQYARQLEAQSQPRSFSASSSRPSVQTTLNPGGSYSRPKFSPAPVLTPSQEQQTHKLDKLERSHGHPATAVKPEPGSSKQQHHFSSPLANRPKSSTQVVDLTGNDSSDDDVAEVEASAFSPSKRTPRTTQAIQYQNRPPFDPNNMPPMQTQARGPAMPTKQQPRQSMPGAWPGAVELPSANNGYIYGQPQPRPQPSNSWMGNTNLPPAVAPPRYTPTPYNGTMAIGGSTEDKLAEALSLFTPSARGPAAGAPRTGTSYGTATYGGVPSSGNLHFAVSNGTPSGTPSAGSWYNGGSVRSANRNPYGTAQPNNSYGLTDYAGVANGGGYRGASHSDQEDDSDDDVIYGGSRPLPGVPAGYPNQESYRDRFDEMISQNPAKTMEEINALMDNIRPDEDTPPEQLVKTPVEMNVDLHKYQELGLTWLKRCEEGSHKGGILADDMGLGKTIQMLSLIVTRKSSDPLCKTTLIVAPVALMRQWKQEIETRLKPRYRLSVHIHHGPSRKKKFNDLRYFDVVLTTFGTLTAELKKLEKFALRQRNDPAAIPRPAEQCALLGSGARWYRVVLDEAQCIKNNNTQGAKAACRLHTTYRFCMTGTPMMNNVDELWSLIHFLRIKPYNDRRTFQDAFTKKLKSEQTRNDAMQSLQALIRSIMLRRTKQSKWEGRPILNLPERTTHIDNPVFSEDEQEFYKALESRSAIQFNKYLKEGAVGSSYSAILVLLLRLRQACCHPHLIKDFGVSAAAGVSPDTLIDLAKKLEPNVVERIKEANGNFECPVCYDAVTNPAIFVPCGHDTCQECFAKIADNAARNGEGGGAAGNAKCPNCRGEINSKRITDFESFKKVHMPDSLTEEEQEELQKLQEQFDEDSETEDDDDSETDSDDGDEDDVDEKGNIRDFIFEDDVEDSETESEAEEDVKAEVHSDEEGITAPAIERPAKKDKGKAKEKVKKPKKSKKVKGKRREKQAKAAPTKTLAELKKMATRSHAGRKAYIKKLNEDWVTSAKIEKTMETLKEIMEAPEGEKVLIFSQWTSLLDLLECPISRESWGYRRYDGSMSAGMRGDAVDAFRDTSKDVRIMLVSLKAGNAGLNLNMASRVIILDPFWNPYIEEQAIDRAHRIGQQRPVKVHRMLIEGTVEDRIIALQEKKRQLIGDALDEKASQSIARLGARELAYLFGVTRRPDQPV